MSSAYLEGLDALLGLGLQAFSEGFRRSQARQVASRQQPDGGFPARQGFSDLYYTDFALRTLVACGSDAGPLEAAASFVARGKPRSVVECFSVLNSARLLELRGFPVVLDRDAILATIGCQALAEGGFARPDGDTVSAYNTFIAALCYELLGLPFPAARQAEAAVRDLQVRDGGFRESAASAPPQTNATAAALTFLMMMLDQAQRRAESVEPLGKVAVAGGRFLATMQAPDGGLRAHRNVSTGDLLSTFTGLLTLATLGGLKRLDLPAAGRFVRGCAVPGGGFGSSPADEGADLEYTYYGLGCLAILATQATAEG